MLDSFELWGKWWLPENSNNKVSGKLIIKPENFPNLQLNGQFTHEPDYIENILGFTANGKKITLRKCLRASQENSIPGYTVESYQATLCIIGHHYNDERNITFKKIYLSYEGFEEWMGYRLFRSERSGDDENRKIVIKGKLPDLIVAKMDDCKIQISYTVNISSGNYVENVQKTSAWISIEFNDLIMIDDIWSYIQKISDFFTLGVGKRTNLIKLKASADYLIDYPGEVELYYPLYRYKEKKSLHPFFMVFAYHDISSHFEQYIKNWFDFVNKFKPTYELFFSTFKNPFIHQVDEFLSLIQALESYHSRKYTDDYVMPIAQFRSLLDQVRNVISNYNTERTNKDYLLSRINFLNTKSLRRRLREIYSENVDLLDSFIDDRDYFIAKIVDTRNYYTHYSERLKDRIIDIKSLPMYSQKLKWIILIIMLSELEFPQELQLKALEHYQNFASIKAIY